MAKAILEKDRFGKATFNDKENLNWIMASVEAYFDARTDDEIKKIVEKNRGTLSVPIADEGELHFTVDGFFDGIWVLTFCSSTKAVLDGKVYILNQTESDDLYDWTAQSKVGEFTYFLEHTAFHKDDGIYVTDRDYILNGVYI
jgi:hypothetical protein